MMTGRATITLLALGIFALAFATGLVIFWQRGGSGAPVGGPDGAQESDDHAVMLHLKLSNAKFGTDKDIESCQALEVKLEALIEAANVGLVDGNEIGGGECVIFMYGPNAD